MQERTYSDLLTLIRSLAGVGGFTAEEQTSILSFVNRRASEAYNMSQSWPRYLVVGEERAIDSSPASTIPYAEAGKKQYTSGFAFTGLNRFFVTLHWSLTSTWIAMVHTSST
jgi:hypothetical protein